MTFAPLPDPPARPHLETVSLGKSGNLGSADPAPWWSTAIRGDELDAVVFPPLTYLVDRLLVAGSLTLLAGPPKAGKSMLAFDFALAVACGGKALGALPVSQRGDVLLVSLDDQSQARAQRRLRAIMRGEPIPAGLVLHTDPAPLGRGHRAAEQLGDYLDAHPRTSLVIVDTLEHLRGTTAPRESAYTADVRMLGDLRRVVALHPGVTLLILAHTRKQSGEADDAISAVTGTHGVTGGADGVIVLSGQRSAPRRIVDVVSRDGEDRRVVVRWTEAGLALTDDDPDDPAVSLTPDDAAVYREVVNLGGCATAADLEHLGLPKIGNRLSNLARGGYLTRKARGVYST